MWTETQRKNPKGEKNISGSTVAAILAYNKSLTTCVNFVSPCCALEVAIFGTSCKIPGDAFLLH